MSDPQPEPSRLALWLRIIVFLALAAVALTMAYNRLNTP